MTGNVSVSSGPLADHAGKSSEASKKASVGGIE
jgi:hypothetical protein